MAQNGLMKCRMLLIGGSAGSLEVMLRFIPALRGDLPFPTVIVLHRMQTHDNLLEELFMHRGALEVIETEDKTPLLPGKLYIAPADYHILFEENGQIALDASEKVNFSRPSIDVAFESAAEIYGAHAFALLLSGANADGTAGLSAIKAAGGVTAVQDPREAIMPFMPANALEHMQPDFTLAEAEIVPFLNRLAD